MTKRDHIDNMKTMKNKIIVVLMAAAIVLPAMAQFSFAQEPNTQFQSTSSLSGSGSTYSSSPTLGSDGTAAYNDSYTESSQPSSGPRRVSPPTPENDPTPVGDAALPLLLMAVAFAATVAMRNRRHTSA